MNEKTSVTIDGIEYTTELTEQTRELVKTINFIDLQLQQLNNEWAVADTARIGYEAALRQEISNLEKGNNGD